MVVLAVAVLAGCGGKSAYVPPKSALTPEGAIAAAPPQNALLGVGGKHIDAAGALLVERFEGFSSCPYPDPVLGWSVPTRGFGETEGIHRNSPCISRGAAQRNLIRLLESRYMWAARDLGVPLNQSQWDSLGSTLWNLGAGIIGRGTQLGNLLRARNYRGYANALLAYDHAGGQVIAGLRTRREAEARLFLAAPPKPKPLTYKQRVAIFTRLRVLRRELLAKGCDRRRDHHQKLGPTCKRWFAEGARLHHALVVNHY